MTDQILSDILENVKNSIDNIQELDKKFELHKQKVEYEISKINELDETQNKLIDEHISGVNTLRDMHVAHRLESFQFIKELQDSLSKQTKIIINRLEELEKPSPWSVWLKQNKIIAASVVVIVAGATTLIKFWEHLSKFLGE